jgi:hypothetical protein
MSFLREKQEMKQTRAFILLAATAALFCPSSGHAMDIVTQGGAVAVVVVRNDAETPAQARMRKASAGAFDCSDQGAARVLADWIEKITGTRLQIVGRAPEGAPALYVGSAAVAAGLELSDVVSPTNEGLRIISDGRNRVLIGGQSDTATVKAACRFLEELGCRYFMDNDLGEVYPQTDSLSVGELDIAEKPALTMRSIWGSQWTGQSLWKVWNGAGGRAMSTGHSWAGYVDQNLFDSHPEYFALRDGRRRKGGWYCTSNPQLREVFARGVVSSKTRDPSVSPPDGTGYCQCEACRLQDDPNNVEPSSGRPSVTNRYADFLDEVGRRVAKVRPESLLSFYCYADYTQPPTLNRRLSPNLVAWIAPIRYSRFHRIGSPASSSRIQLQRVIDGWAASAEHIAYRTYNYNLAECLVPFSKLSVWAHDIPYLRDKGCIGINLESLTNWEIYGPHLYQSIRLAYNPDADSAAMMDDYFMKFYGPKAGVFMKRYWLAIDAAFAQIKCESGSFFALHLVYTPQFLQRLEALVTKAAQAAEGDTLHAARVSMTREGLDNAVQYVQLRQAMNAGDFLHAKEIYEQLFRRNEAERKKGYGNHYTLNYLERFLGTHVRAGAAAAAPPNKVLCVLEDRMKLAYDHNDTGTEKGCHGRDFDDSSWRQVATFTNTLNAQGLPDVKAFLWYRTPVTIPQTRGRLYLFFTEVDGQAVSIYLNGRHVASLGSQARRKPFEVDITEAAEEGTNVLAVRVDHRRITELFLGGIIRPVLLIEKPDRAN